MSTPGPTRKPELGSPAASLRLLGQQLQNELRNSPPLIASAAPGRGAHPELLPPHRAAVAVAAAARDAEVATLRQQLLQLTSDFKYNLKLLEERDLEVDRLGAVLAGVKESAAAREAELQAAGRRLAERDAALRAAEARASAAETRATQASRLAEAQVADARAARDEELARCQATLTAAGADAAKAKADVVAGYEQQLSDALCSEAKARAEAEAAREEAAHLRGKLQRAEARIAEQELVMGRMVSQFEGALSSLQALEAQYGALADDSAAALAACTARVSELQEEVAGLQSRAAAAEAAAAHADEARQRREEEHAVELAAAKQQYQRATLDGAELSETLGTLRSEHASLKQQLAAAQAEAAAAREVAEAAQAQARAEAAARERAEGLAEAARLSAEAARRGDADLQAEAAALRQAAALLEAKAGDNAKALEAANGKLAAADKRVVLLGQQLEQERRLHEQMLAAREAEVGSRLQAALEAAAEEKNVLQEALGAANTQLRATQREVAELQRQLQHLQQRSDAQLAAAAAAPLPLHPMDVPEPSSVTAAAAAAAAAQGQLDFIPAAYVPLDVGSQCSLTSSPRLAPVPTVAATTAAAEGSGGGTPVAQAASRRGRQPWSQLQPSALPPALPDGWERKLSQEQQHFAVVKQQLDQQLAQKQQVLMERQAELQRLQQRQRGQQQQAGAAAAQARAPAPAVYAAAPPSDASAAAWTQLPVAADAGVRQQFAALRLAPAAAAEQGSRATASYAPQLQPRDRPGMPHAPAQSRMAGEPLLASSSRLSFSSRPAAAHRTTTTLQQQQPRPGAPAAAPPAARAAVAAVSSSSTPGDGSDELDPLSKARRQIQICKGYLRQFADMGKAHPPAR